MTEGTTYKTEHFEGTMKSAFGSTLKDLTGGRITELAYKASYKHILNYDDVPEDEQLSPKDMLAVVNEARKANARQKAMSDVLEENKIEKPELKDSLDLQIKTLVKGLVASGKYTEAQAYVFAKDALA